MDNKLKEFINTYKVPINDKIKPLKIGSGTNGDVYNIGYGKILKFGSNKTPKKNRTIEEEMYDRINRVRNAKYEYNITKYVGKKLNAAKKPKFVPEIHGGFYGNKETGSSLFIMNKVKGMTLQNFFKIATPEQLKVIRETLVGYVEQLEKIGVVHGDLNPNNIMIEVLSSGKLKVTLIDFGRGRRTKNEINTKYAFYHPWDIILKNRGKKVVRLPYVYVERTNQPTALSNQDFINAFFGNNGTRATQLKNAINIIVREKDALTRAQSRVKYINGVAPPTQKQRLMELLSNPQLKNERIQELINILKTSKAMTNNATVEFFINRLQRIKNDTLPSRQTPVSRTATSPSRHLNEQISKLYTLLSNNPNATRLNNIIGKQSLNTRNKLFKYIGSNQRTSPLPYSYEITKALLNANERMLPKNVSNSPIR
jgi:serine/threonine protein kinase